MKNIFLISVAQFPALLLTHCDLHLKAVDSPPLRPTPSLWSALFQQLLSFLASDPGKARLKSLLQASPGLSLNIQCLVPSIVKLPVTPHFPSQNSCCLCPAYNKLATLNLYHRTLLHFFMFFPIIFLTFPQ